MLGNGKHYKDAKALRLDVAAMFSAAGRSFHSGKGGGRQKKYICNGAAGGCQATVRAYRQRSEECKVTSHVANRLIENENVIYDTGVVYNTTVVKT
ncbi:unnamed protein product [Ectocarpus sp. CCAP 1310/34]|nr:unnamed protein product [Ectocarpus sp. CCAP 1310/34]